MTTGLFMVIPVRPRYAYDICSRLDAGDDESPYLWLVGPEVFPPEEAAELIENAIATVCTEYEPTPIW